MYLLAKFGGQRSYRNRDINSYINSLMDTLENAELTASIRHNAKFFKSEIPIFCSKVSDKAGRKTRIRTHAIAKRFAFCANVTRKALCFLNAKIHKLSQAQELLQVE